VSDTKHIQLFNRDGTSQQQRRAAEIDPLYAKIDDRQLKDLLSFLWKIAKHIQYYDLRNSTNGNWQNFIGVERAVMLSLIAAKDTAATHNEYLERQSKVYESDEEHAYQRLFVLLRDHCLEFKKLYDSTWRILDTELFLSKQNKNLLKSCIDRLLALYGHYRVDEPEDPDEDCRTPLERLRQDMEFGPLDGVPGLEGLSREQLEAKLRHDLYGIHQDLQRLFETIIGHAGKMLDETMKRQGDFQPHVGLILTFLRLFGHYQTQLNGLTARHLKFYYRDVLKIDYREKIADRVFVMIQLAKHADVCRLQESTAFKAGKDSEGKNLIYEAAQEFVANKAQIADLKSVYRYSDNLKDDGADRNIVEDSNIVFKSVKAATKANSGNGVDEELDKDNPQFPPFGNKEVKGYAELGFALSGPLLRLAGGERTVTILLDMKNEGQIRHKDPTKSITVKEAFAKLKADLNVDPNGDTEVNLNDLFEIHLSCEKGWEEFSGNSGKAKKCTVTSPANTTDPQIKVEFTLDSSFPAIVDVIKEIHSGQFAEKWPVCKVVLKNNELKEDETTIKNRNFYELCRHLSVMRCELKVEVSGLKNLVLQNDFGLQKPEKPIMIFGNAPKPGAAFYIGSQEVFAKKLDTLSVKWEWIEYKNHTQLSAWYANYVLPVPGTSDPAMASGPTPADGAIHETWVNLSWKAGDSAVSHNVYFGDNLDNVSNSTGGTLRGNLTSTTLMVGSPGFLYPGGLVPGTTYYWRIDEIEADGTLHEGDVWSFVVLPDGSVPNPGTFKPVKITFERLVDNQWQPFDPEWDLLAEPAPLFGLDFHNTGEDVEEGFIEISTDKNKSKEIDSFKKYTLDRQDGFIRIILEDNDFLFRHEDYAKTLMAANAAEPPLPVNPPITPMIQNVELDYTSSVCIEGEEKRTTSEEEDNTQKEELKFFHLHPFGISREVFSEETTELGLVCDISDQGYFYIGLKNLKPPQNVSLLFQFVEGTGNLTAKMPDEVKWSYLAKDGWKGKEPEDHFVLSDGTRDFSGTGIVLSAIPENAVDNSTIMPAGYHWIRAAVKDNSQAVNMLASVQAQAMELEFSDQGNAADHYEAALQADTISKLQESMAQVKAVTQPFASFGGRPRESRDTYFVRVSERLRHKDRAVTLWDYERLVLEYFPKIHKVKCLNHTNADAELKPGHVKLVVIPNLTNLNAANILKPAVSILVRDTIKAFLKERCSAFVELDVGNPKYEVLTVWADVVFRTGHDEGYYSRQLSEDIKDFLTPWKKNPEDIHFRETLHSSVIVNFIEERRYVDYLTSFKVVKDVDGEPETIVDLDDIVRSRADSLLVSAQSHEINKPRS